MPRLSLDQVQAAITDQVTDGITHAELLAKLDSQYHPHLRSVVSSGAIVARVETQPDAAPVLRYYLA
jgi:hypothetical protein